MDKEKNRKRVTRCQDKKSGISAKDRELKARVKKQLDKMFALPHRDDPNYNSIAKRRSAKRPVIEAAIKQQMEDEEQARLAMEESRIVLAYSLPTPPSTPGRVLYTPSTPRTRHTPSTPSTPSFNPPGTPVEAVADPYARVLENHLNETRETRQSIREDIFERMDKAYQRSLTELKDAQEKRNEQAKDAQEKRNEQAKDAQETRAKGITETAKHFFDVYDGMCEKMCLGLANEAISIETILKQRQASTNRPEIPPLPILDSDANTPFAVATKKAPPASSTSLHTPAPPTAGKRPAATSFSQSSKKPRTASTGSRIALSRSGLPPRAPSSRRITKQASGGMMISGGGGGISANKNETRPNASTTPMRLDFKDDNKAAAAPLPPPHSEPKPSVSNLSPLPTGTPTTGIVSNTPKTGTPMPTKMAAAMQTGTVSNTPKTGTPMPTKMPAAMPTGLVSNTPKTGTPMPTKMPAAMPTGNVSNTPKTGTPTATSTSMPTGNVSNTPKTGTPTATSTSMPTGNVSNTPKNGTPTATSTSMPTKKPTAMKTGTVSNTPKPATKSKGYIAISKDQDKCYSLAVPFKSHGGIKVWSVSNTRATFVFMDGTVCGIPLDGTGDKPKLSPNVSGFKIKDVTAEGPSTFLLSQCGRIFVTAKGEGIKQLGNAPDGTIKRIYAGTGGYVIRWHDQDTRLSLLRTTASASDKAADLDLGKHEGTKIGCVYLGGTFMIVEFVTGALHCIQLDSSSAIPTGPIKLPRGLKAVHIAVGHDHVLMTAAQDDTKSGTMPVQHLYSFGSNQMGQLGHGGKTKASPNKIAHLRNEEIASILAVGNMSVAKFPNGRVISFGDFGGIPQAKPVDLFGGEEMLNVHHVALSKGLVIGLLRSDQTGDTILKVDTSTLGAENKVVPMTLPSNTKILKGKVSDVQGVFEVELSTGE